jgi:hypothetical protein
VCVHRFERNYGPINTKMFRTLGKLTVIDNPRTSFIKDDKKYLISVREYDDVFSDYKSAEVQVRRKLETKELSGTDRQETAHLLKPKNLKTMMKESAAAKDREKD